MTNVRPISGSRSQPRRRGRLLRLLQLRAEHVVPLRLEGARGGVASLARRVRAEVLQELAAAPLDAAHVERDVPVRPLDDLA